MANALPSGWPDFIDLYMRHTDGQPTPEIFRLWSAISCISGALGRRVWAYTAERRLFTNLYVVLVAKPGIGKSVIKTTEELWRETRALHIAPSSTTAASLLDCLLDAKQVIKINEREISEGHSLLVPAAEFGVFLPAYDHEFLNILNDLFDNPPTYSVRRKYFKEGKEISVVNPQLNILAGTQPGYLSSLIPEVAWTMGFTSRIIFIYASQTPKFELFSEPKPVSTKAELVTQLIAMTRLGATQEGFVQWTRETMSAIVDWDNAGGPPTPEHSKLEAYIERRTLHILKLSIISAVSRTGRTIVELCDFERARRWLLAAEAEMPNIFRDMVGKSDMQILQELHFYMWKIWCKTKEPQHESQLFHFLAQRAPSERLPKLLEVAQRSNMITKKADGQYWIPRPLHEHGVE